ncbi:hypothetical protein C8Q80DRAFT_1124699 [Daedaleopsis nitida]|nr:hypothetical protein C8Q80DRAFT_1124699 [Daedaleopsis nitida]
MPALEPVPPAEADPVATTRRGRKVRIPKQYEDFLPSGKKSSLPSQLGNAFPDPPTPPMPPEPEDLHLADVVEHAVDEEEEDEWTLPPDGYGVWRRYLGTLPQRDPLAQPLEDLALAAPGLGDATPCPTSTAPGVQCHTLAWMTHGLAGEYDSDEEELVSTPDQDEPMYGPFENTSQFRLTDHYYGQSDTHSQDDFDDLVHAITSEGFNTNDVRGFTARKAEQVLDDYTPSDGVFSGDDGWIKASVEVSMPKTHSKHKNEADTPTYTISGVVYRRLLDVIKSVVSDPVSRFKDTYHWMGHALFWTPSASDSDHMDVDDPPPHASSSLSQQNDTPSPSTSSEPPSQSTAPDPIRVHTDFYNSDAVLQEEAKLRKKPRIPTDALTIEYVILPLLFWSDSTHLSSFGTASLWPIYLYFGNLSKYVRGRLTEFAGQHLAYIPEVTRMQLSCNRTLTTVYSSQLGDAFKAFYTSVFGRTPTDEARRFCKRELFQQIWKLILDGDFIEAYEHGFLITCGDDYPEKMLALALRAGGKRLCPRCYITADKVLAAGTKMDDRRRAKKRVDTPELQADIRRAREYVFQGHSIASKRVKNLLDDRSLNPIQNAFSEQLSQLGLNCYELFAPDLMHEFELGVWRGSFNHLMRLLAAQGPGVLVEYDRRMRLMPTFGRDRIRRFWNDVSSRKKLAARDYEAFLQIVQTIMPAYEGRGQDSINARTHPDVMLLASGPDAADHPYWYARILDLFHADVRYHGPGSTRATQKWQHIEFAWVCWFKRDREYLCGFMHRRLPRIRFMNDTDTEYPFGFIDPDNIIRASFLMPAFAQGRTDEYLGPSKLARRMRYNHDDEDWTAYYVCIWVDRDMYMHYHGGGIGQRRIGVSLEVSRRHGEHVTRKKHKLPQSAKGKAVARDESSESDSDLVTWSSDTDSGGLAMDVDVAIKDSDEREDDAHEEDCGEQHFDRESIYEEGDDAMDAGDDHAEPADYEEDEYDDPVYAAEGYADL